MNFKFTCPKSSMRVLGALLLFGVAFLPLHVAAQNAEDAPPPQEAPAVTAPQTSPPPPADVPGIQAEEDEFIVRLDVDQIRESGGMLIYVLLAMSVVAFALIIYFFVTLNTSRVTPSAFLRDVEVMLKQGRFEEARNACNKNGSPAADIVLAAVNYVDRMDKADPDLLRQVVEGEGIRQASRLQSQITYLMDIGVIAPMVGLLGTVMGMLTSFSAVALDIHKAKPMELANGVSTALVTTAAGLMVAIPAMMFYSFFRGRVAKLTAGMELAATNVITLLTHRTPRT
ncbi:MAG: MotA/TolQ/ExbB proton channel family protein [Verrucomicrobia bacterium]|nr:MotA/TolQ/ExbB proton channel family protein [Verrucomicrobiota bacterium]MCH8513863.1 MotA/TolQ/ExbB proton channel family protein [Kiritimatiellia bacterium]